MTCESHRTELLAITSEHSEACSRLTDFTETYLHLVDDRPLMLVNGQKETLLRYAREAERLAKEQREAFERFVDEALGHAEPETAQEASK